MVNQISRVANGNAEPARMGASRMSSLDVMKCFAAFCVVWIHYGVSVLGPVTRCAVPLFFIITGYYYPMMIKKGKFWRHVRKLLVMVLCASALYGVYTLQREIRQDTLGEWINNNLNFRTIGRAIINDKDLFAQHLWYFWAVLYDLVFFYFADKWKLNKWLRYAAFLLLLTFLMTNFTLWNIRFRNYLFFGLPCMMIGRMISEKKDAAFSFLGKKEHLRLYTCIFFFLVCAEFVMFYFLFSYKVREMYFFTLPLLLPIFYCALRNPTFGEGSWMATIGRKYSAYIYIFHVLGGELLSHVLERDASLPIKAIYPFLVFGVSLIMSWLFVYFMQCLRKSRK